MPQICAHIFRKVNPTHAFVKKKDAENHVALLAIRKLRERGHLDAHLFPNVHGGEPQSYSAQNFEQPRFPPSSQDLVDLTQPRKKKQITDEQKSLAQQNSKKFH